MVDRDMMKSYDPGEFEFSEHPRRSVPERCSRLALMIACNTPTSLSVMDTRFEARMFDEFIFVLASFSSLTRFAYIDCEVEGRDDTSDCSMILNALNGHTRLQELKLYGQTLPGVFWDDVLVTASRMPQLRNLDFKGMNPPLGGPVTAGSLAHVVGTNSILTSLVVGIYPTYLRQDDVVLALSRNWSLLYFETDEGHLNIRAYVYTQRNRASLWNSQKTTVLDVCIGLMPLRLTSYVLLWILEFLLPPTQFPDQHDNRIIRLVERVQRAYSRSG